MSARSSVSNSVSAENTTKFYVLQSKGWVSVRGNTNLTCSANHQFSVSGSEPRPRLGSDLLKPLHPHTRGVSVEKSDEGKTKGANQISSKSAPSTSRERESSQERRRKAGELILLGGAIAAFAASVNRTALDALSSPQCSHRHATSESGQSFIAAMQS